MIDFGGFLGVRGESGGERVNEVPGLPLLDVHQALSDLGCPPFFWVRDPWAQFGVCGVGVD